LHVVTANNQALTLSILLGWISYVIALSQAGKSPLIVEALKGNTTRGLGVFMSMAGGKFSLFMGHWDMPEGLA